MGLILILFLTAAAIAGSAAYFSVLGLAAMFAAAYWPVVIMGGSLELGKLVAASFVYRTWASTGFLMKTYLISAILILMVITSLGIFGFLSKGYGESTQLLQQVEFTTEAKQREVAQVDDRLAQINRIIEEVPNNYVTKRIELQREYAPEVDELEAKRAELREEMAELRHQKMEADAHIGPIIYVAEMFGVPTQEAVKFFIFALIIVFDPMAVVLTLATNHAIEQWQQKRAQRLAEKREHELAMAHEKHANAAPEAPAGPEAGKGSAGPVPLWQVSGPLAAEPAPAPAPASRTADAGPQPLNVSVPTKVAAKAVKREPSASELNAVIKQAPSAKRAAPPTTAAPIEPEPMALDNDRTVTLTGVTIPDGVVGALSRNDQTLIRGMAQQLPGQTLAAQLGMSDVNLRKRALYLAERLNASGYAVDPKRLFA